MHSRLSITAMKKRSVNEQVEVQEAEEPATPAPEGIQDPFSEFRYKTPPLVEPLPVHIPRTTRVSVYKARKFWRLSEIRSWKQSSGSTKETNSLRSIPLSSIYSSKANWQSLCLAEAKDRRPNFIHPDERLSLSTSLPEKLTLCSNKTQDLITPPSKAYIRKPRWQGDINKANLSSSLEKESHSLKLHQKEKQCQLRQENHLMKKSGKNRESLLLRRQQVVPKISELDYEKTPNSVRRCVTPQRFPDWVLWAPVIYDVKEKNGIAPQLRKCERGYDIETHWFGHPEITDELRKKLLLNEEHIASSLKQNNSEIVCADRTARGDCVPTIPRLGVLGFNYNNLQHHLKLPIRKTVVLDHEKQGMKTSLSIATPKTVSGRSSRVSTPRKQSTVGLSLGHVRLFWSTDPGRSNKTWVVELGCSAEINRNCIDYVLMQNTGTTEIRFTWVKKNSEDLFQRRQTDQMRIIFDCCGGIILPGDVYRVPFMYKAVSPGQFTEDWELLTQPVLENGAKVILRLWGFTRQADKQLSLIQEKNEDNLMHQMSLSIARHIVQKLVNSLPIDGPHYGDRSHEIPIAPLKGPNVFVANNPWLYYNSYHVGRLVKIANLIAKELKKQPENVIFSDTCFVQPLEQENISSGTIDQASNLSLGKEADVEVAKTPSETGSLSEELISLRKELDGTKTPKSRSQPRVAIKDALDKKDAAVPNSGVEEITGSIDVTYENEPKTKKMSATSGISINNPPEQSEVKIDDQTTTTAALDPDISVNTIREDLIACKENYTRQDALFTLMAEEVSHLLFKPFNPFDNWEIPLVKGLFSSAMDSFGEYADALKGACYLAKYTQDQILKSRQQSVTFTKEESLSSVDSAVQNLDNTAMSAKPSLTLPESSRQSGIEDLGSRVSDIEPPPCPQDDLEPERYKDQYLGRLYSRMHALLVEVFESMDMLLHRPGYIDPRYGKEVFIKINKVSLNVDIKNQLERPLPPKWVDILNKMNKIKRKRRHSHNTDMRVSAYTVDL